MRVIRISVVVLVLAAVGLAGPKDVQRIRPLRLPEPVALLDGTVIMATNNTWQSKDGDWGNTASWSLGIVPTSGHAARFDATSQVKPTIRISLGSNGPDTLTVTEQFHGGIGGPGNYLSNVAVNTTKIVIRGDGDHYIRPTNDASPKSCCYMHPFPLGHVVHTKVAIVQLISVNQHQFKQTCLKRHERLHTLDLHLDGLTHHIRPTFIEQ
ncbi:hypothetical protein LCGC14_0943200, partial [marine sediment metagenome]